MQYNVDEDDHHHVNLSTYTCIYALRAYFPCKIKEREGKVLILSPKKYESYTDIYMTHYAGENML